MRSFLFLIITVLSGHIGIGQTINNIYVYPANPNENDVIRLVVSTTMNTSSCWITNASSTTNGSTLATVGAHCSGLAQQTCTSSDTFSFGQLPPSIYNYTYTMFYSNLATGQTQCSNFSFADTLSYNFEVHAAAGNLPAEIHPAGDHHICDGDSMYFHTNQQANQTYQWFYNGLPMAGETNYDINAEDSGLYFVRVYENGDSGTSAAVTLHAHSVPHGPLFLNDSIVSTNYNATVYQWHTVQNGIIAGANGSSTIATTAGEYFVEMTNSFNCEGFSDTLYVEYIEAELDANNPTEACLSDSLYINVTPNGSQYQFQWLKDGVLLNGETYNSYKPVQDGHYQCVVSISQSSDTSASSEIILHLDPSPTVSNINDTLYASGGLTYQWHQSGVGAINGATDSIYIPSTSGTYYVVAINEHGCEAESFGVSISPIGISENFPMNEFIVSQSAGSIEIVFDQVFTGHLAIYSAMGQLIEVLDVNSKSRSIDINRLSPGIYILNPTSKAQGIVYTTKKVVIN